MPVQSSAASCARVRREADVTRGAAGARRVMRARCREECAVRLKRVEVCNKSVTREVAQSQQYSAR